MSFLLIKIENEWTNATTEVPPTTCDGARSLYQSGGRNDRGKYNRQARQESGSEFRLRARRGRDYTTILDFANVNIVSLTPGSEWTAMGRLATLLEFWSEENASASGERTEGTKEEPAGISRSRRVLF